MARIAAVNAKGTRDFLPRDLVRRNRIFSLLRETFEHHGYEPIETPAIENTNVLEGKYGEEGDRLLFRILKRGESLEKAAQKLLKDTTISETAASLSRNFSDEALRYDLTVPFARVIAAHQNELVFPFRRYQMQPVWRGDRPQHGRYREFYQCDIDCVGSRSMTVDAEMATIYCEVFTKVGLTQAVTRINHRGLLKSLMSISDVPAEKQVATLTAMDKLDKIGLDGVRAELVKLELGETAVDRLVEILGLAGAPQAMLEALRPMVGDATEGLQALDELAEVFGYVAAMGVPMERISFDVSLVRGLSYYTGTIYETILPGSSLGSLGGGGRYDQLIGQFIGRDLPCVGVSFGLERIQDALDEQQAQDDAAPTTTQALMTVFTRETLPAIFALANELRAAGIRTELYPEPKKLSAQLNFANDKGIPLAVILGPDELAAGTVVLRDMRSSTQHSVPLAEAVAQARALLS